MSKTSAWACRATVTGNCDEVGQGQTFDHPKVLVVDKICVATFPLHLHRWA